jgi:hypothetical protein
MNAYAVDFIYGVTEPTEIWPGEFERFPKQNRQVINASTAVNARKIVEMAYKGASSIKVKLLIRHV